MGAVRTEGQYAVRNRRVVPNSTDGKKGLQLDD